MRVETCQDGIELHPRPHCCKHIKPNSKSIVILIESFNIMGNVRVGLRQSKLGQNVEILYLNVNRTEKIRDSSDLQSLPEPNSLTDKTGEETQQGDGAELNCFVFFLDGVGQEAGK